jgi:hypothetical protein
MYIILADGAIIDSKNADHSYELRLFCLCHSKKRELSIASIFVLWCNHAEGAARAYRYAVGLILSKQQNTTRLKLLFAQLSTQMINLD